MNSESPRKVLENLQDSDQASNSGHYPKPNFAALKLSQNFFDSPIGSAVLSPISDLAVNLHSLTTKSSFTPKRKISWSSDSPARPFLPLNDVSGDSPFYNDSPSFQYRLLKNVNLNQTPTANTSSPPRNSPQKGSPHKSSPQRNSPQRSSPQRRQTFELRVSSADDCRQQTEAAAGTSNAALAGGEPLTFHRASLKRLRSLPNRRLVHQPLFLEKENVTPQSNGGDSDEDDDAENPKEVGEEVEVSYAVPVTQASPITTSPLGIKRFSIRSHSFTGHSDSYPQTDYDSQDSGCVLSADERMSQNSLVSTGSSDSIPSTQSEIFHQPLRAAPRRSKLSLEDSKCDGFDSPFLLRRPSNTSSVLSSALADAESNDEDDFDDGFLDVFNDVEKEENTFANGSTMPQCFGDLLTRPILRTNLEEAEVELLREEVDSFLPLISESPPEPSSSDIPISIRRSFSMLARIGDATDPGNKWPVALRETDENQTDATESNSAISASRKRMLQNSCEKMPFKRPDPPGEACFLLESKRRKSVSALVAARRNSNAMDSPVSSMDVHMTTVKKSPIQRSQSMSDVHIDSALRRSEMESNLSGDYSGRNMLPVLKGRHPDLKTISAETLSNLVSGKMDGAWKYSVIDCRYPYEYIGGHIQGAMNIYTKENIYNSLLVNAVNNDYSEVSSIRHILIFHCEFSSERGPNLYRFLRKKDREANKDNYPNLFYPEIYLLEGGYKEFFGKFKELCQPQQYLPMNHKDHRQDLCHFRAKSKSWTGDSKARNSFRPGLKL